ncbi:MAG: AAA family ATPase [Rhizobiaceae bacterium]
MTSQFFVFTGGPGSGKTSLIQALAQKGFATAPEAGRAIIRAQQAIGGDALPWRNRQLFAELMLSWDMRSHDSAAGGSTVLFDRGVPDTIGYMQLCGLEVPAPMWLATEHYRYNPHVFVLPPWPEIYANDTERKQSLGEAERTFEAVTAVYRQLGYTLVEVPRGSVSERAAFVAGEIMRALEPDPIQSGLRATQA